MVVCDVKKCDFCGTCVAVCPHDAINLYENDFEGIKSRCTNCNICVSVCPLKALSLDK